MVNRQNVRSHHLPGQNVGKKKKTESRFRKQSRHKHRRPLNKRISKKARYGKTGKLQADFKAEYEGIFELPLAILKSLCDLSSALSKGGRKGMSSTFVLRLLNTDPNKARIRCFLGCINGCLYFEIKLLCKGGENFTECASLMLHVGSSIPVIPMATARLRIYAKKADMSHFIKPFESACNECMGRYGANKKFNLEILENGRDNFLKFFLGTALRRRFTRKFQARKKDQRKKTKKAKAR